jgi:hypothetical protein
MHPGGGNWRSYIQTDEEQDRPNFDRAPFRRVMAYARPYGGLLAVVIGTIV